MINSLLVPLDGSILAEQAVPIAAELAEELGATLSLAIVHPWGPSEDAPRPGSRGDREFREEEGAYLNRLMKSVAAAYSIPVREAVLDGNATGPALVKYADEQEIDLVVASTHQHGFWGRLNSTGVARVLAHRLHASVLFVKPQTRDPLTHVGGFSRIVIPLDGTPRAAAALRHAASLGSPQAEFMFVGVVSPHGGSAARHRADAESYFESLLPGLAGEHPRLHADVLMGDDPAEAIVDYAVRQRADLIALTTRPRGPMAATLFGSTADAILRKATVPVLVCHADDGHSPGLLLDSSPAIYSRPMESEGV
jgi:nucleotide-binding universal stress UspA family protein